MAPSSSVLATQVPTKLLFLLLKNKNVTNDLLPICNSEIFAMGMRIVPMLGFPFTRSRIRAGNPCASAQVLSFSRLPNSCASQNPHKVSSALVVISAQCKGSAATNTTPGSKQVDRLGNFISPSMYSSRSGPVAARRILRENAVGEANAFSASALV